MKGVALVLFGFDVYVSASASASASACVCCAGARGVPEGHDERLPRGPAPRPPQRPLPHHQPGPIGRTLLPHHPLHPLLALPHSSAGCPRSRSRRAHSVTFARTCCAVALVTPEGMSSSQPSSCLLALSHTAFTSGASLPRPLLSSLLPTLMLLYEQLVCAPCLSLRAR
eukprot:1277738-Rhodomonas_salina.2